jgi:hypothetical protein
MLTRQAGYLFGRTGGHIGSYITLITRGCWKAITTCEERLSRDVLDQVRIDEAAEQARRSQARPDSRGQAARAAS